MCDYEMRLSGYEQQNLFHRTCESRGFSITANKIVHPKAEIAEMKLQVIRAIVNPTSAEHAGADVPVVFPLIYSYLHIKATQLLKTRVETIVQP